MDKQIKITKNIVFNIDTSRWVVPFALHIDLVGNRNHLYLISLDVLCFRLIWDIFKWDDYFTKESD